VADYLPPGSCTAEYKAVKDAKGDLDKAWRAYQSAEHNMQAGGVSTAGAGVGALACTFATAGVGAVLCLGGAGLAMLGGLLWTESAGEGLINAQEDLEDELDKADAAIDAMCKCISEHMVSIPD
jgi:hypothetical protein